MATNVHTAAGSKLYIGGTGALAEEAAWVEVGEIIDFGEFGKTYNLVTHNPVGDRATYKFKGSYNNGSLALQIGQDPTDAGQEDLLAALETDYEYNFKVELNDAPDVSGATNTTKTFKGVVMSYTDQVGSVDSIVGSACTIEISGDITTVYAAS